MDEIIVIEKRAGIERDKARVAAYCRVSTDLPGQEDSFDTQVRYYQIAIGQNLCWEYAGVYADKGYSGTSAKGRPEFMRLIKDAHAGEIDIILTKSISRFARNVVDCQTYTRELKSRGVEVRFEREQISSLDPTADFIFTILAAIAQEESHSISQNVRWRYEQNFKQGICRLGNNRILGFDMNKEGKLVPNKDAWIPELIFTSFAEGMSLNAIAKKLNDLGAKRMHSERPYSADRVRCVLRNENFVGDMLLQKKAPLDYLTKKPQTGIAYKSYYIKNAHEGIISQEVWERVQNRIADIAKKRVDNPYYYGEQQHFLYGKVFCGGCGAPYTRRTYTDHKGEHYKAWNCKDRQKGKKGNGCKNPIVREAAILQKIAEALGTESFCKDAVDERVAKVIISELDVQVILKRMQGRLIPNQKHKPQIDIDNISNKEYYNNAKGIG